MTHTDTSRELSRLWTSNQRALEFARARADKAEAELSKSVGRVERSQASQRAATLNAEVRELEKSAATLRALGANQAGVTDPSDNGETSQGVATSRHAEAERCYEIALRRHKQAEQALSAVRYGTGAEKAKAVKEHVAATEALRKAEMDATGCRYALGEEPSGGKDLRSQVMTQRNREARARRGR
jgi:hypothetical protein